MAVLPMRPCNSRKKRREVIMPKPSLHIMAAKLTIHRLSPAAEVPQIVLQSDFYSITQTADELTIICDSELEIASER